MAGRKLSPIEFTVLGVAWKRGPATTYVLMKELSASNSTYYRSKAGTVYPLVTRLVKLGLLEQEEGRGERGERLVAITKAGQVAVTEWVRDPIPFSDVAYTIDLVRLRVFYLGLLSPQEREEFRVRAMAQLREHLGLCEDLLEHYRALGDHYSQLAIQGVILESKARLQWLDLIG